MNALKIINEAELRPCYVIKYKNDAKKPWLVEKDGTMEALFHCWNHVSQVVPPSNMIGGHNGGIVSGVVGIVEFANGSVSTVNPEDIVFIDNKLEEYAWFVDDDPNPLEHPERYLEDAMVIIEDMPMAQRKALLAYLQKKIEGLRGTCE